MPKRSTARGKQAAKDNKKDKKDKYGCKDRAKFRATKAWKEFRKSIKEKYKVDPITLKPLTTHFNLHHMRCDGKYKEQQYYEELNEEYFMPLNAATHDTVHFLWTYYKKDPEVIGRLIVILEEMKKLNGE